LTLGPKEENRVLRQIFGTKREEALIIKELDILLTKKNSRYYLRQNNLNQKMYEEICSSVENKVRILSVFLILNCILDIIDNRGMCESLWNSVYNMQVKLNIFSADSATGDILTEIVAFRTRMIRII
jgi:hypothetical protein